MHLLLVLASRDGDVGKHRLVVSMDARWANDRYTHHSKLVAQSSQVFTTQFHCTKPRTKLLDSTDVRFLEYQHTSAEFTQTKNPDLDRLVTVSHPWLASTLAEVMKPIPLS